MNINTNLNVKNQSFKNTQNNIYNETSVKVNGITDKYINTEEIKTPGQIAFSVGMIGLKTFICGAGMAVFVASLFKSAPEKTTKALKDLSNNLIDFSKKVVDDPATKTQKAMNFVKKSVGKVEEVARETYKKVICKGFKEIPQDATEEIAKQVIDSNNLKAFTKLGGFAALASLAPDIMKSDKDGNGIVDVLQRKSNKIDSNFKRVGNEAMDVINLASLI